jgi:hypothetical protein
MRRLNTVARIFALGAAPAVDAMEGMPFGRTVGANPLSSRHVHAP